MQALYSVNTWWRHQMETFSALLAICVGNSPVTDEFPEERSVMRSFDVFFDLRLNKRLSKQWWGWWFETPSCHLWRHYNERCAELEMRVYCEYLRENDCGQLMIHFKIIYWNKQHIQLFRYPTWNLVVIHTLDLILIIRWSTTIIPGIIIKMCPLMT